MSFPKSDSQRISRAGMGMRSPSALSAFSAGRGHPQCHGQKWQVLCGQWPLRPGVRLNECVLNSVVQGYFPWRGPFWSYSESNFWRFSHESHSFL